MGRGQIRAVDHTIMERRRDNGTLQRPTTCYEELTSHDHAHLTGSWKKLGAYSLNKNLFKVGRKFDRDPGVSWVQQIIRFELIKLHRAEDLTRSISLASSNIRLSRCSYTCCT
ncbi:hypothetical protein PHYPO_G00115390 [Pangasianodon hypophthalmus]|uniref:Uncharacterized protein n=1 Tax=Pangasianodon hypophthalmus TaxID=310915 RepID=A0A5N5L318_PANHP|nr:hypothetical protein PHYPO_G00115390 [Pangasianodon hypophthalmus]